MSKLTVILLLGLVAACAAVTPRRIVSMQSHVKSDSDFVVIDDEHTMMNTPELVSEVNSKQTSWKAGVNRNFDGWTVAETKKLMGTKIGKSPAVKRSYNTKAADLPAEFDARTAFKGCVGPVLNQGSCGSCWAFGAAESVSDRFCIVDGHGNFTQRAPLDLVTCDQSIFGNHGCEGGELSSAWEWIRDTGIVTESCLPYLESEGGPIATCPPDQQPCTKFVDTPKCSKVCKNQASYSAQKRQIKSVYGLNSVQDMMAELVKNGPFEAAFSVYADFVHYKSGVYKHTTGSLLGGHAIKIIGYGSENGQDYWLVQNSWTTTWGDGGYFKIARGVDECGIEDSATAGEA